MWQCFSSFRYSVDKEKNQITFLLKKQIVFEALSKAAKHPKRRGFLRLGMNQTVSAGFIEKSNRQPDQMAQRVKYVVGCSQA